MSILLVVVTMTCVVTRLNAASLCETTANRNVLNDFFAATGGLQWISRGNWNTTTDIQSWKGVTCAGSTINQLTLVSNGLRGTLPLSLTGLTRLAFLALSRNALNGTLPALWTSFSQLATLILSTNQLSGSLPDSWSIFPQLSVLDISNNFLSGTLSDSWINATTLTELHLGNNSLTGTLPDSWTNMSAIGLIDLSSNALRGTLNEASALSSTLYLLRLSGNSFSGTLPNSWATTNLAFIDLRSNDLHGTLPASWSNLNNSLTDVYLSNNSLAGPLPDSWSSLVNLLVLEAQFDRLEGTLPDSWSNMSSISTLRLNNNFLRGTLPDSWSALNVRLLFLNGNALQGTLPQLWGSLSLFALAFGLRTLALHDNAFEGQLPALWSNMSLLTSLTLSNNSLSGTLPAGWPLGFRKLSKLSLDGNQLSGTIPPSWIGWPIGTTFVGLTNLNLSQNMLVGYVPRLWQYVRTRVMLNVSVCGNPKLCLKPYNSTAPKGNVTIDHNCYFGNNIPMCNRTLSVSESATPISSLSRSQPSRSKSSTARSPSKSTSSLESASTSGSRGELSSSSTASLISTASVSKTNSVGSASLTRSPTTRFSNTVTARSATRSSSASTPKVSSTTTLTRTSSAPVTPSQNESGSLTAGEASRTQSITISRSGISRSPTPPATVSASRTRSFSCSSRDSTVYLAGSQLDSKTMFLANTTTAISEFAQVAYWVMRQFSVVLVLRYKHSLTVRGLVRVDSSICAVSVLSVEQPPAAPWLTITLLLDAQPNINLINVRAETLLHITLNFSVAPYPACHLLVPSTVQEETKLTVMPPITRQPPSVSATGLISGAVSCLLANPTPALQQAILLSFIDAAACAYSDVEPLESSSSPFGLAIESSTRSAVGQYYRGTVVAFLACMAIALSLGAIGVFAVARIRRETILASAAKLHFPSILIVPFSMLVQGAALSSVSLLRLSLSLGDVVLASVGIALCWCFIAFTFVSCSSSGWFDCAQEAREMGISPRLPLEILFKYTLPRTGWLDTSAPGRLFKRRYLLFFNDNVCSWYCSLELAAAAVNGGLQGVRVNDYNYCLSTVASLFALQIGMLALCALIRPCAALSDNIFLLAVKTVNVCCAGVAAASVVRQDDSLLGAVNVIGTGGSILEDAHTALTVLVTVALLFERRRTGWSRTSTSPNYSAVREKNGGDEYEMLSSQQQQQLLQSDDTHVFNTNHAHSTVDFTTDDLFEGCELPHSARRRNENFLNLNEEIDALLEGLHLTSSGPNSPLQHSSSSPRHGQEQRYVFSLAEYPTASHAAATTPSLHSETCRRIDSPPLLENPFAASRVLTSALNDAKSAAGAAASVSMRRQLEELQPSARLIRRRRLSRPRQVKKKPPLSL